MPYSYPEFILLSNAPLAVCDRLRKPLTPNLHLHTGVSIIQVTCCPSDQGKQGQLSVSLATVSTQVPFQSLPGLTKGRWSFSLLSQGHFIASSFARSLDMVLQVA